MHFLEAALLQALPWMQQCWLDPEFYFNAILSEEEDGDSNDASDDNDDDVIRVIADLDFCEIDIVDIHSKLGDLDLAAPGLRLKNDTITEGDGSPMMMSLEPSQVVSLTNQFLSILSPRERQCRPNQVEKYLSVEEDWNRCTGWDQVFSNHTMDTELFQTLYNQCGTAGRRDVDACVETLLGDNPVGFAVRDVYSSLKKFISCYNELGEGLPRCWVSLGMLLDHSSTKNTQDSAYRELRLSLTFLKKATCLMSVGVGSLWQQAICANELDRLEQCLAVVQDGTFCETIQQNQMEKASFLLDLPSKLTQGKILDVCLDVVPKDNETPGAMEYFADWMSRCHGDDIILSPPVEEKRGPKNQQDTKTGSAETETGAQPDADPTAGPETVVDSNKISADPRSKAKETVENKPDTESNITESAHDIDNRASHYGFLIGITLVFAVGILIWQRMRKHPVKSGFQQVVDTDVDLKETEMGRFY